MPAQIHSSLVDAGMGFEYEIYMSGNKNVYITVQVFQKEWTDFELLSWPLITCKFLPKQILMRGVWYDILCSTSTNPSTSL